MFKRLSKVPNLGLRIFFGTFLCAACSLVSPTANANLIDLTHGSGAGSFELGLFVNNGFNFMALITPGDTTITGWTVGAGNGVNWLTTPTYGAASGIHSVDLQHFSAGSIATVIPTVVGDVYDLSFGAATVTGGTATGVVSAGSLINQAFVAAFSNNLSNQTYTPFNFRFTATSLSTPITFQATAGSSTAYGPVIDSVSVVRVSGPTPSVPEPSSIALLLLGGGVLCARAYGKRRLNS